MDDLRPLVCLERTVELEGVRLRLRDWPGTGGPLVHIPDPGPGETTGVDPVRGAAIRFDAVSGVASGRLEPVSGAARGVDPVPGAAIGFDAAPDVASGFEPVSGAASAVETFAAALSWRFRVLSLSPRGASPYQVDAFDILATLDQFGFPAPVLVGERLGCVAALLVAGWHAERVAGLVLLDATYDAPASNGLAARALRECPPNVPALRSAVRCPVLVLQSNDLAGGHPGLGRLAAFLTELSQGT